MSFPNIDNVVDEIFKKVELNSPPVDLDKIIKLFPELQISEDEIEADGYIVDLGNIGGQIILNKDKGINRKRYTLAHELGHWIVFRSNQDNIQQDHESKNDLERWCNKFAACLLLPSNLILSDIDRHFDANYIGNILSLPAKFLVSREAILIRVSQLSEISFLHVENNKVTKKYLSNQVRNNDILSHIRTVENQLKTNKMKDKLNIGDRYIAYSQIVFRNKDSCEWIVTIKPRKIEQNQRHNNPIQRMA